MFGCAYRASRPPGEVWKVGGEPLMGMPPLLGDGWFPKKGNDLVHSLVYCVAVVLVAPSADSSGDVVALYVWGAGGDVEEYLAVGGDFVLRQSQYR
jgi:hypothetical protein